MEIERIVIFPDFQGKSSLKGFQRNLIETLGPDNTLIIPILNGSPAEELDRIAKEISNDWCKPIIAEKATSLMEVLMAGYSHVLDSFPETMVVRLDTAEHPINSINRLVYAANALGGMIIGDLEFDDSTLKEESIDRFIHLEIFPELYRQTTDGKLVLSCAHGFQVFPRGTLKPIFEAAQKIIEFAKEKSGEEIKWGLDGAMALGALLADIPVNVEKVSAIEPRNRTGEAIAKQYRNALRICMAGNCLLRR